MTNGETAEGLLGLGLGRFRRKLDDRLIRPPAAAFRKGGGAPGESDPVRLTAFPQEACDREAQKVRGLRAAATEFNRRYARAATDEERREHVLDFARELGS